ncbi:SEC7 domain-containing protein [Mycena venus]|uniref:SEC7 domain-containing protein n=1 Tax=Mycena venus TaxID=2733690 RepID=A0A8H7D561_9AGAR|nr:SEC7 domain-containing protein [Mycena venus]
MISLFQVLQWSQNRPFSEQREQRMLAVAKLKRAASLPRMKDGRRPPMHPEAVSEGEKVNTDDERKEDEIDTPPPEPPIEAAVTEPDEADTGPGEDATITPDAASRSKRRSRSRTRSRGSKDMKLKNRAAMSPTPSPLVPSDSSQDEAASPLVPLASPIPNLAALTRSRLLRSPTPPPPPPNSPHTIPRGLFRSNSVGSTSAARTMAMHKLTGGTETYDPSPSPTPPPLPAKLGRNNTVSGGERTAARQFMLSRLGGRIAKEPVEGEPGGSGGEEYTAPSPTPKRKRRRSRRGSGAASANANTTGVSDSEFISTSPNTPIVPPTPLPGSFEVAPEPRLPTPSLSRAASPRSTSEEEPPPLPPASARVSPAPARQSSVEQEQKQPTEQPRRRSVVVEDEDDEQRVPLQPRQPPTPPQLPQFSYEYGKQSPQLFSELLPENIRSSPIRSPPRVASPPTPTAHSSRRPTPEYPLRSSPFTVPLQEKQSREEEEEEEVLYPADSYHSRNTYDDEFERQISWVASPVPEIRMPIDDDDERDEDEDVDDEEEEEEEEYEQRPSPRSSAEFYQQEAYDDTSPRNSFESKGVMIEPETSPEIIPSHVPPSPSSVTALSQPLSQPTSIIRTASDDSTSPQQYPARLSVASRTQDRSPLTAEFDWEDVGKRNWDGGSTSTWDKIKGTFRSGSAAGRRSRTNSIVTRDRRDHTDSSVSRESGASLTSAKTDKVDVVTTPVGPQPPPVMLQSASASASTVSLSPNTSLFPAATSADLMKYQNVAKLFPFPGMKKLEEQRNRAKGMLTPSASTPDIATLFNGYETDGGGAQNGPSSFSNTPAQTPEMRDRKLSHQASDTRLLDKYAMPTSPINSAAPASPATIDYFNVPAPMSPSQSTGSTSSKLPMTLPGVKQWLISRKKTSASTTPTLEAGKPSPSAGKKPSLSDLIPRKDNAVGRDWEDVDIVPLSASESMFGKGPESRGMTPSPAPNAVPFTAPPSQTTFSPSVFQDTEKTPKAKKIASPPPPVALDETSYLHFDPPSYPSISSRSTFSNTGPVVFVERLSCALNI